MKILVGCEESQMVCKAFRSVGHEAYSCDLKPCSGGHPEWHINGDVFRAIEPGQKFFQNGDRKYIHLWDMGIFFPDCTHLAVSGSKHFEAKRKDGRQKIAIDFFLRFTKLGIPRVCIENPVGIMSKIFRKPDQIINPWQFGDSYQKTTCLWLKSLPKLFHASEPDLFNNRVTHVGKGEFVTTSGGKVLPKWYSDAKVSNKELTRLVRSKTFPGIAKAMAEQWGNLKP